MRKYYFVPIQELPRDAGMDDEPFKKALRLKLWQTCK